MIKLSKLSQSIAREVIKAVAIEGNVTVKQIRAKKRTEPIANARHLCCWILVKMFGGGLAEVGVYMKRDHTTVLNSVRRIDEALGMNDTTSLRLGKQIDKIMEVVQ